MQSSEKKETLVSWLVLERANLAIEKGHKQFFFFF